MCQLNLRNVLNREETDVAVELKEHFKHGGDGEAVIGEISVGQFSAIQRLISQAIGNHISPSPSFSTIILIHFHAHLKPLTPALPSFPYCFLIHEN